MTFSLPILFGAGVLSFASPCVLPMMPLYLGTLASGNAGPEASTRRTLTVGTAFAAGLSTVFVGLGAFAGPLGAALVGYRPWFLGGSALLLLVLGLRGLGVIHFAALDRDGRPLLVRVQLGGGVVAAFIFGAAFALGWSPCIGPVLASVLTFAATNTHAARESAGYLAVYAAGFSTPLLVLAAFASRANQLVRSLGRYTPFIERLTGGAMLLAATVAFYGSYEGFVDARTITGASSAEMIEVPSSVASGSTCHEASGPGVVCGFQPEGSDSGTRSVAPSSGKRVVELMAQSCPACERMRAVVAEVAAACSHTGTRVAEIDVGTPSGRALGTRFGIRGTPTFLFLDDDGNEVSRIVGETDAQRFVHTTESAFGLTCKL